MGASKSEVLDSCPCELEYLIKAFEMERKHQDEMNWLLGIYIESAVSTAIEHNFAGKKAKTKYLDKPLLQGDKSETEASDNDLDKQRKLFMAKLNLMKSNFEIEKKRNEVEKNAEHNRDIISSD